MDLLESELTPDSILPAQLYDRPLGGARLQPEKRLQVAVLADALVIYNRCAADDRARRRRVFVEVETWFASDETGSPFAFMAICDSLKLDPGYVRRGLRQWRGGLQTRAVQNPIRRDSNGSRHQVVMPRLRRVA